MWMYKIQALHSRHTKINLTPFYTRKSKNKTKLNMSQALEVTPSMLTNHKGKETQTSLHKKMYHHCKFLNKTRQNIFAKHESFISVR